MSSATGTLRERIAALRPPRDRHDRRRDALLVAVLVMPVLAQAGVRAVADRPWWPLLLGGALLVAVIRACRTLPVLALVFGAALLLVDPAFAWALPVLSYLVGRRSQGYRLPLLGFAVLLTAGSALAALRVIGWVHPLVGFAFLGITPWLLGRYRRQHVALSHAGWERAEHLEREQRIVTEQARLRERARISQDMHDSLGHELALIALQAGSLELADELGEQHRAMAGELRERAAAATERLREIIGVLREETDTPPVEPHSQSITGLVGRCREAGMAVTLHGDEPAGQAPENTERAAFRVVQEALTNAAKHAPGTEVTVRIHRQRALTTVSVINLLPAPGGEAAAGQQPDHPGSEAGGQGLLGLRERARLLGGTVTAEAGAGVFEVTARLPHDAERSPSSPETAPEGPPTESTVERAHAHRRARRSLAVAVAGSAAMAALIVTVQVFAPVGNAERSFLPPERFGRITVGQDRQTVAELLPPEQITQRPPQRPEPLIPDGAVCEYYSAESNAFGSGPMYRLCFSDGRLVSKDVLPSRERSRE